MTEEFRKNMKGLTNRFSVKGVECLSNYFSSVLKKSVNLNYLMPSEITTKKKKMTHNFIGSISVLD